MDIIHLEKIPNKGKAVTSIINEVLERRAFHESKSSRWISINLTPTELAPIVASISEAHSLSKETVCEMISRHRIKVHGISIGRLMKGGVQ